MKRASVCLLLLLVGATALFAQLHVSGDAATAFVKSNDGVSQYDFDGGRGTFAWRLDLFGDAVITDDITFLSNFRMLQDQIPHIDMMALRVADIAESGVSIQAGEIDVPFGNLSEDRFPKDNPFFDLPLMNEHVTSLCRSDYKIWTLNPEYQIVGDGVRLIDQGLYDLGVKVYGSVGLLEYSVALTNGMISTTGTYSPNGLNSHHELGRVIRLAVTPLTGFTVGASYAAGPFMDDQSEIINDPDSPSPDTSAFFGISPDNYLQHIYGGDLEYSLGYFSFSGEMIDNTWHYLNGVDLKAFGYSAMMRYQFTPRFSAALRAGGLTFNTIKNVKEINLFFRPVLYTGKWDHDVFRLEGVVGYKLDRALLLKAGYQINRTYDLPRDPVDNFLFLQSVLSF